MGSKQGPIPFEQLTLALPTPAERSHIWAATHPQWGAALDIDAYLKREEYLTTLPMSRNGGITHWILTTKDGQPDARPLLSSCESIRKRCLIAAPEGGAVRECTAHGIASVFTEPEHRGNGYASKMMALLGPKLDTWQGRRLVTRSAATNGSPPPPSGKANPGGGTGCEETEVACSVLFSDIGKTFYAKNGWPPFESSHLSFTPSPRPEGAEASPKVKPVSYHELAELCSLDEKLLKASLGRPGGEKTRVALVPDLDAILWHLMREDFMTKHIFGKTPTIRGGQYGEPGKRVWAVWTRGYYGGLKRPEVGNTMHVLRLVMEDEEACDEAYLTEAVSELLKVVREEAAEWKTNYVEMWNPSAKVRGLVERAGVPHEFVERESSSIASLNWYGDGDVEWVANEKFGWC